MTDYGPICSLCTRDWDQRLGYCEHCESEKGNLGAAAERNIPASAEMLEDNFS